MTQEELEVQDSISGDQVALDAEQGLPPEAPQYVTTTELEALREANRQMEAQIRGLQSGIDKQIARQVGDIRRTLAQREAEERRKTNEALLASVPEEQQPAYKAILDEQADLRRRIGEAPAAPAPVSQEAMTPDRVAAVKAWGHDPEDPRIDWAMLDRSPDVNAFIAHIYGLSKAPAQAAPATTPRKAVPGVPPTADSRPGRTGATMRISEIQDAYIRGELSVEDYRKRLQTAGVRS